MKEPLPLRLSTVEKEGIFSASKWLKYPVLFNSPELKELLELFEGCFFLPNGIPVEKENLCTKSDIFFEKYQEYLEHMKREATMPSSLLRRFFTVMVTPSLEDVYGVSISPTKYIIKPAKPVIFLQLYHCYLSPFDQEFHSMALSPDSFALGLQVSYPQVWENPNTHLFSKTFLEEGFACTPRFKAFMKWQRQKTRPALFERNQEKVYAPFRIGKTGDSLLVEHKGLQKALEKANIALKIKDGHER